MRIQDFLSQERCAIDADLQSQKRVFEFVAQLFSNDLSSVRQTQIYDALVTREKLGSTSIGFGIALPHARVAGLEFPIAALIRLKSPLDFKTVDHIPIDLFFVLLVPESACQQHLDILALIATKLNQPEIQVALRKAKTTAEFYAIITETPKDPLLHKPQPQLKMSTLEG